MSGPTRIEFAKNRYIFIGAYVRIRPPALKSSFNARIKSWDLDVPNKKINSITVWGGKKGYERTWTVTPDCITEAFTEFMQNNIRKQRERSET